MSKITVPYKPGVTTSMVARENAAYGDGYQSGLNENIRDAVKEKSANILSKIGEKSADWVQNNLGTQFKGEVSDKLAEIMGDNATLTGGLVSAGALGAGVLAGHAINKLRRSIRKARRKRSKEQLMNNKARLSMAIAELKNERKENKKLSKDINKLTKKVSKYGY